MMTTASVIFVLAFAFITLYVLGATFVEGFVNFGRGI